MVLLPRIVFVPRDPNAPRVPQPEDMGYGSTNHLPTPRDPNTLYNVVGRQSPQE
jgi:hypothetical protein